MFMGGCGKHGVALNVLDGSRCSLLFWPAAAAVAAFFGRIQEEQ